VKRLPRALFEFERHHQPLAPPHIFLRRLVRSGGVAAGIILFSLAIGVIGYRVFGGLESWVDCLYNASMILGGMGPVDVLRTDAGKVFASAYALYSGVVLLASVGVLLAPVLHRVLHHFHIETDEDAQR
jgi:hypothetical protein